MFTPDCAFSPEREAERKRYASLLNPHWMHTVNLETDETLNELNYKVYKLECLTQSP